MLLIGVNRSPYTRRVAITLNLYGLPYEQRPLTELLGRLTQADVTAAVAERLARGLGVDTAALTPRLRALAGRLEREPAFNPPAP